MRLLKALSVGASMGVLAVAADGATTVTVAATSQGIVDEFGRNNAAFGSALGNMLCGRLNTFFIRNFAVFTLGPEARPNGRRIVAATFAPRISFNAVQLVESPGTYVLRDVQPAFVPLLAADATPFSGRLDIYNDLASGVIYGERVVTLDDNPASIPATLDVALTPAFVQAANALLDTGGGSIALGGSMVIPTTPGVQSLFAFSSYNPPLGGRAQLILTLAAACPGDLNADSVVDDLDFQIFVVQYDVVLCSAPEMPSGCSADLNADGVVDDLDFQTFVVAYDAVFCP